MSTPKPPITLNLDDVPGGSYVSWWMNELHEQIVFVRRPAAETAELWHEDNHWKCSTVVELTNGEIDQASSLLLQSQGINPTPTRLRQFRDSMPKVKAEGVVLDTLEQEWLDLCWRASAPGAQVQQRRLVKASQA